MHSLRAGFYHPVLLLSYLFAVTENGEMNDQSAAGPGADAGPTPPGSRSAPGSLSLPTGPVSQAGGQAQRLRLAEKANGLPPAVSAEPTAMCGHWMTPLGAWEEVGSLPWLLVVPPNSQGTWNLFLPPGHKTTCQQPCHLLPVTQALGALCQDVGPAKKANAYLSVCLFCSLCPILALLSPLAPPTLPQLALGT